MKFLILSILILGIYGCSTKQEVEFSSCYTKNKEEEVSSAIAIVTKEMIEDVKKRREKFLKNQ